MATSEERRDALKEATDKLSELAAIDPKSLARASVRDGVPPIELVEMLEELKLGLKPIRAYEIDAEFFANFR